MLTSCMPIHSTNQDAAMVGGVVALKSGALPAMIHNFTNTGVATYCTIKRMSNHAWGRKHVGGGGTTPGATEVCASMFVIQSFSSVTSWYNSRTTQCLHWLR